jgi:hypothetical protein
MEHDLEIHRPVEWGFADIRGRGVEADLGQDTCRERRLVADGLVHVDVGDEAVALRVAADADRGEGVPVRAGARSRPARRRTAGRLGRLR